MRILLARHGNTFGPQDPVVWLGRSENPCLVARGMQQAAALAEALHQSGQLIQTIYASPMRRTTMFAELARPPSAHHKPVVATPALLELDYGKWAGRTRTQLIAAQQQHALTAWETRGVYPDGQGFMPPLPAMQADLAAWLASCLRGHRADHGLTLAVSHGGTLRVLHQLLAPNQPAGTAKMACGHVGVLDYDAGQWRVVLWNTAPQSATLQATLAAPLSQRP
jgi:broad specificity phosphatase PhoE